MSSNQQEISSPTIRLLADNWSIAVSASNGELYISDFNDNWYPWGLPQSSSKVGGHSFDDLERYKFVKHPFFGTHTSSPVIEMAKSQYLVLFLVSSGVVYAGVIPDVLCEPPVIRDGIELRTLELPDDKEVAKSIRCDMHTRHLSYILTKSNRLFLSVLVRLSTLENHPKSYSPQFLRVVEPSSFPPGSRFWAIFSYTFTLLAATDGEYYAFTNHFVEWQLVAEASERQVAPKRSSKRRIPKVPKLRPLDKNPGLDGAVKRISVHVRRHRD